MSAPHILFVTGKLAEPALLRELDALAPRFGFLHEIAVLPITVVALAPTAWIARHLTGIRAGRFDRVVLPGLCKGDLDAIERHVGCTVERGPKDLRDLPEYFGEEKKRPADYGAYDVEILAEINNAPQLSPDAVLQEARRFRDAGADVIDLGCDPGATWEGVGDAVRALRDQELRVSIDSFNLTEVTKAVEAGAELVLSVNSTNVDAAKDWGCEVVAIPDDPATLDGLDATIDKLCKWSVPFRIDPVLEPIGYGFAQSLGRYLEVRRRYPDAEMMMGVGNLTELTDVDSAGVNVTLLGFCQELGIRSVLTTEVISWCGSCVRELDRARRLVYHAVLSQVLPKHLEPALVMLRDPKVRPLGEEMLGKLAEQISDRNYRIFAENEQIHVLNASGQLQGIDPFKLFAEMQKRDDVDPSHAFYLGYEMAKAVTALTLGKQYVQDQALRWGLLTREEESFRDKKGKDPRDPIE